MSDRIEGIAILDERGAPSRLHFVAVRENGDRPPFYGMIPVRQGGTPEIPESTTWEYEQDGEWLNVRPSVKMSRPSKYDAEGKVTEWQEFFHNDGQWRVRFERYTVPIPPNENREDGPYSRINELNRLLLVLA